MRSTTLLLALFFVTASALASREQHDPLRGEFAAWVRTHAKSYSNEEFVFRWTVWRENLRFIDEHNHQANHTYRLAMNEFGDLTADEFQARYAPKMGLSADVPLVPEEKATAAFDVASPLANPASIDWRARGAVTPVKNQGSCGASYAFSATGAIESANWFKTGTLKVLSEQNLVDCAGRGCESSWAHDCFSYVQAKGGIDTEAAYPYEARVGPCRYNPARSGGTVSQYKRIPAGNEQALLNAVATIGPVSIAFNSGTQAFAYYSGGILDVQNCGNTPTLAVLIVGYGTENGRDFWILKNAWGTGWGEKGYFRMARGKNMCGIADWASYPMA